MNKRKVRALRFERYSKTPQLEFAEVDYPSPGPNELLVKVYAAGLKPVDNMIATGVFKPILHNDLPAIMGSEFRYKARFNPPALHSPSYNLPANVSMPDAQPVF